MPDRRARTRCLVPLLLGAAPRTVAQTRTPDLERLSHEELMQATVSAALGVPEPTMTTPAAAHVITGDDIRRPGATSLAEARRLAPGGWRPDSSRERDVSGCRQRRAASALLHRLLHGFLSLVVLSAIPALPSSAQPTPEYELKAAFLSKFPEFTEWPKEAIDSRPTIDLCVAAPNPFGAVLEKLAAGEALEGRRYRVREVDAPAELEGCRVLFVPATAGRRGKRLLDAARQQPVLTVGETDGFLDEGGLVCLQLVEGRVRFDIDTGAARRVGIRFSSQLLRLARVVRGEREL